MDTSINMPDNYLDKLLSLSDEMKLRIINKLSESLLNSSIKSHNVRGVRSALNDNITFSEDIQSLIGIASGISDSNDERLTYLLNK